MTNKLGRKPKSVVERFWSKVKVGGDDDCWEWQDFCRPYGSLRIGEKFVPAHRLSWEIHFGKIPEGLLVLHKCDNPPCVNPKHLFVGTYLDNMKDKISKGRQRYDPPIGNARKSIKLLDEDVLEIRRKYASGMSCINIAKEYGICRNHANRIVSGKRRQHVK